MRLTEAEALCRALKSELLVGPLFHQLEPAHQGSCDGGIPGLRAVVYA
jgi:hypothetical protein